MVAVSSLLSAPRLLLIADIAAETPLNSQAKPYEYKLLFVAGLLSIVFSPFSPLRLLGHRV